MRRIGMTCLVAGLLGVLAARAGDQLVVGTMSRDGTFLGFRNGRFEFDTDKGKTVKEMANRVSKLVLASPGKARLVQTTGTSEEVLVRGFEKSQFVLEKDGRELRISPSKVRALTMDAMDFNRVDAPTEDDISVISRGEAVDMTNLVAKGKITVVHVHSEESMASQRLCAYVEGLQDSSKGKVTVLRVVISDWSCPFAAQFDVKAAPQFWFYNKNGQLVKQLTERFTPADFDDALKQARR